MMNPPPSSLPGLGPPPLPPGPTHTRTHLHTGPYFWLNLSIATCSPSKKIVPTSPSDCRLKGAGPGTAVCAATGDSRCCRDPLLSCSLRAVKGQPDDAAAAPAATDCVREDTDPALLLAACVLTMSLVGVPKLFLPWHLLLACGALPRALCCSKQIESFISDQ